MPTDNSTTQTDALIEQYNLGKQHYQNREYRKSIEYFTAALPHADALFYRADAYYNCSNFTLAFNDLKTSFQQNPNDNDGRKILSFAHTQYQLGYFNDAIINFTRVIGVNMSLEAGSTSLDSAYDAHDENSEQPITHINLSDRLSALLYRGECYFKTNALANALNDFLTFEKNMKMPNVRCSLRIANIYNKQHQYENALKKLSSLELEASPPLSGDDLINFLSIRQAVYVGLKDAQKALIDVDRLCANLMNQHQNQRQYFEQLHHFLKGDNVVTTNATIHSPATSSSVSSVTPDKAESLDFTCTNRGQCESEEQAQLPSGKITYKSTIEGSSIVLDELVFIPAANEEVDNGLVSNTRFFKPSNGDSSDLVVKRDPALFALKHEQTDQDYENEANIWNKINTHYPPARFFKFPHASCRLVLPRIPGIPLKYFPSPPTPILRVASLQICLAIGLALQHKVHEVNLVHGDLKMDNVIVNFNKDVYCYQATLIDFGLTTSLGQDSGAYESKKSFHIAPELYGENEIPSAYSADVYSFSSTILSFFKDKELSKHLTDFLKAKGRAEDAKERPSLEEVMAELWKELIHLISIKNRLKNANARANDVQLIKNFIQNQDPLSFSLLMRITNQLNSEEQVKLKNVPILVTAIINTHAIHASRLPAFDGFVLTLLKSIDPAPMERPVFQT